MARTTIRWGRIVAISLILTIVDIILHAVGQGFGLIADFQTITMPAYEVLPQPLNDKVWAGKVFLPLLAMTFFLSFTFLQVMFCLIQERLPGTRMSKGVRYGIAFWGLWAFGILEWHYIYNSSWAYDLFNTAFLDGGFMFITSLLAGRFLGTDSAAGGSKTGMVLIPVIAVIYVIGRYFNYLVMDIVSAQHREPLITFICLVLVGLWIGYMYYLLRPGVIHLTAIKRALFFGVLLFGTNWWFFAQFEPMLMKISLADPILRVAVDIIMVVIGVSIYEKALNNNV